VFADDIWYSKFRADPLNAEEGMRYRREVLEKGGSQDEMKTLRDYLGHMPETKAFYQELGL
jgi:metallopeptidase MepB